MKPAAIDSCTVIAVLLLLLGRAGGTSSSSSSAAAEQPLAPTQDTGENGGAAPRSAKRRRQLLLRRRRRPPPPPPPPPSQRHFDLDENRITNGALVRVRRSRYPFYVQLDGCGGVLVAKDVVLTAAHCAEFAVGDSVVVGAKRRDRPTVGNAQRRAVTSKPVVHPGYASASFDNDLALFRIEPVTKPHLKPIPRINADDAMPRTDQALKVVGMGAITAGRSNFVYRDELRQATFKTVSDEECKTRYGVNSNIIKKETMVCAADFVGGRDSCLGDSGGPLFTTSPHYPTTLIGTVSFNNGCADSYYPTVYSRVSGNIKWIRKTICQLTSTSPAYCPSKPQSSRVQGGPTAARSGSGNRSRGKPKRPKTRKRTPKKSRSKPTGSRAKRPANAKPLQQQQAVRRRKTPTKNAKVKARKSRSSNGVSSNHRPTSRRRN